jgi:hypothetical protein
MAGDSLCRTCDQHSLDALSCGSQDWLTLEGRLSWVQDALASPVTTVVITILFGAITAPIKAIIRGRWRVDDTFVAAELALVAFTGVVFYVGDLANVGLGNPPLGLGGEMHDGGLLAAFKEPSSVSRTMFTKMAAGSTYLALSFMVLIALAAGQQFVTSSSMPSRRRLLFAAGMNLVGAAMVVGFAVGVRGL